MRLLIIKEVFILYSALNAFYEKQIIILQIYTTEQFRLLFKVTLNTFFMEIIESFPLFPNQTQTKINWFIMIKNVGNIDRIIRGAVSVIIILLYFTKVITGTAAVFLGIVALVLLFTSLTSFCPCYSRLKINTSHKEQSSSIK